MLRVKPIAHHRISDHSKLILEDHVIGILEGFIDEGKIVKVDEMDSLTEPQVIVTKRFLKPIYLLNVPTILMVLRRVNNHKDSEKVLRVLGRLYDLSEVYTESGMRELIKKFYFGEFFKHYTIRDIAEALGFDELHTKNELLNVGIIDCCVHEPKQWFIDFGGAKPKTEYESSVFTNKGLRFIKQLKQDGAIK